MAAAGLDESDTAVRLGALGWTWPAWDEAFYPEGMPPDWRLTFYNTQFNCVFLPAGLWRAQTVETWRAWADDTHEDFLFLLEGTPEEAVPEPLRGRALCMPALDRRIIWIDGDLDMRDLAARLRQPAGEPRYLVSRNGDLSRLEHVRTLLGLLGVAAG